MARNALERIELIISRSHSVPCLTKGIGPLCWVVPANQPSGYAVMSFQGKMTPIHRFTYQTFRAEIPPGLPIDHLCRNKACWNPWHLEPVTTKVNAERTQVGNRRYNGGRQDGLCAQGHSLTGWNLMREPNTNRRGGYRTRCRVCHNAKVRKYRQKIK